MSSETYNKICACGTDDWVISAITLHCKNCAKVYQKVEGEWLDVRDDVCNLYTQVRNLKFENARLKHQLVGVINTLTEEREAPLDELRKSLGAPAAETTWNFVIRMFTEKSELANILRLIYDEIRTGKPLVDATCLDRLNRLFSSDGER
jgi:hypothetical protein